MSRQAPPMQRGGAAWLAANEGRASVSSQPQLAQVSLAQMKSISSRWVRPDAAAELGGSGLPHGQQSSAARLEAARDGGARHSARRQGSRPHVAAELWLPPVWLAELCSTATGAGRGHRRG
ncbi:hypothetical protein PVAP13_2KG375530 [Panicum virgatum]|uniref:Uncharacterized protein n=1 Tax=Panicum virgatum TaxID=38727 RepID=A0A8T0WFJ4_PANVG|nr:hypothetical protein PVAP13_2KG375530 [Panicum virgatum]